jgi:hypothetical protein
MAAGHFYRERHYQLPKYPIIRAGFIFITRFDTNRGLFS